MTHKTFSYFSFSGDFNVFELSDVLGENSVNGFNKGDINQRTGCPYRFSSWTTSRVSEIGTPIYNQFSEVLSKIVDKTIAIREFQDEHKLRGTLEIVPKLYGSTPYEMVIPYSIIEFCNSIDAFIDIDYYVYSERDVVNTNSENAPSEASVYCQIMGEKLNEIESCILDTKLFDGVSRVSNESDVDYLRVSCNLINSDSLECSMERTLLELLKCNTYLSDFRKDNLLDFYLVCKIKVENSRFKPIISPSRNVISMCSELKTSLKYCISM